MANTDDTKTLDPFGRLVPTLTRAGLGGGLDCEMGDEDGCDAPACWLLTAPAYTVALFCCDEHAEAERTYHGALDV